MTFANPIRVLILHSDPVACAGLAVTFAGCPDFEIQKLPAHSYPEDSAQRWELHYAADVVVADYRNGVRLATDIAHRRHLSRPPSVVVIAGIDREWEIRSALECGVRGYLLTGCALDELAAGVRAVYRGLRYLSPQVAACLAESISVERLTAREEDVLRLVVEGYCNKIIGRQLGIAVGTVKSHLKSAFAKLGVESRTQAIAVIGRRGLLCQSRAPTHVPIETRKRDPIMSPVFDPSSVPSQPGNQLT